MIKLLFLYNDKIFLMKRKTVFVIITVCLSFGAVFGAAGQEKGYNDESMLAEAVNKFNNKDFAGAHRILGRLMEKDPENDAAFYYMGLVRFALGNESGAEAALKKAVSIDPGNFWYKYRLAVLYAKTGRPELTISMYERLLEDFPKKTELYYTLIDLYMQENRYDDALSTLLQIETVFGETDMTAYARFDLLRMTGKADEGYRHLKRYNASHASPQISSLLGDYYLSRYDKDSAMIMYEEALSLESDYAPALLNIAGIYRMDSNYDDYFDCIERFISDPYIDSQMKGRYLNDAFSPKDPYFLEAFRPQIDSLMETALAVNANDTLMNMSVAYYYFFTGRSDRAMGLFKENVSMFPDSKGAWGNYLSALYSLQKWPEYYAASDKAAERFAGEPYFVEQRGIACIMVKDYDGALAQFDRLLSLVPDDTSAVSGCYAIIGDIYHERGNPKQGNRYYEKVLRLDPDNLPVLNNYAYYLSLQGKNLKRASEMGKKCVDAEPDNPTYLDTYGWILHLLGRSYEARDLFRHAMLYGGRESAVILDHYAEILYSLGDKDLAFLYWNQAIEKNAAAAPSEKIEGLEEKVSRHKSGASRKDSK